MNEGKNLKLGTPKRKIKKTINKLNVKDMMSLILVLGNTLKENATVTKNYPMLLKFINAFNEHVENEMRRPVNPQASPTTLHLMALPTMSFAVTYTDLWCLLYEFSFCEDIDELSAPFCIVELCMYLLICAGDIIFYIISWTAEKIWRVITWPKRVIKRIFKGREEQVTVYAIR